MIIFYFQKKTDDSEKLQFQVCNSNFAQPKLETWKIDLENYDDKLTKAVSKETEFSTANSCPASFKEPEKEYYNTEFFFTF